MRVKRVRDGSQGFITPAFITSNLSSGFLDLHVLLSGITYFRRKEGIELKRAKALGRTTEVRE